MFRRSRDPRQARFLTWASLRWVWANRAWTPHYLVRYWRLLVLRVRHPDVVLTGYVSLGRRVRIQTSPGYGRIVLGRWVHLGDGSALRCHDGRLRIGDKVVFGQGVTVNCFLDVEIGAASMVADSVYVCDFDHRFADLSLPVKDQGIVKTPVRIGPDVWIGTKATVVRGSVLGQGAVVGANAVVTGVVPAYAVAVGIPARVVASRLPAGLPSRRWRGRLGSRSRLGVLRQAASRARKKY